MRCFIGLWPGAAVRAELADLARPSVPGLRWTTADQWHVTLRFCGEVAEGDVPELDRRLRVALAGERYRALKVGPRTELLGSSVLCVPIAGADGLAARVREATADLGLAPPDHAFGGHLTLARAREGIPADLVGRPVSAAWVARSVAIVSSTTDPGGARYRSVASVALRP